MKKIYLNLLLVLFLFFGYCQANENPYHEVPKSFHKETMAIDNMLITRLNLTKEQREIMAQDRAQHRKEMEKILSQMYELQIKIRNVYLAGIPSWQADLRTASMKAELVILKQNADKIRLNNRKKFESILTQSQKEEFEKIKNELNLRRQPPYRMN